MQSIVVGTDGSASAGRAVTKAGELARALEATVHVVSCYNQHSNGAWLAAAGGIAVGEVTDEESRMRAERIVADAQQQLRSLGVESQPHVCGGEPAAALITIAADQKAEMIVVGNRGMNGARRMLGSVPNRVSHQAGCGVLIVPTQC
jgi:nucleotide-binding universal stress UspA family protein